MRRYGEQSQTSTVPGRDAGLKLTLQPAIEPVAPPESCEPAIAGLFWVSDSSGQYDQDIEAAYLLTEGAAGPVLGVAGLIGEDCRLPVTWTTVWTPASGTGGDPGTLEDGARLVVYPLADTVAGVLGVSAEHDGKSYGPILLTVMRYSCYCYAADPVPDTCAPNITGLVWTPSLETEIDEAIGNPQFHHEAKLIGDWCCDCSVAWTWTKTGASTTIFSVKKPSDSRYAYVAGYSSAALNYGYGILTATVTCGSQTFGPFSVRINMVSY